MQKELSAHRKAVREFNKIWSKFSKVDNSLDKVLSSRLGETEHFLLLGCYGFYLGNVSKLVEPLEDLTLEEFESIVCYFKSSIDDLIGQVRNLTVETKLKSKLLKQLESRL